MESFPVEDVGVGQFDVSIGFTPSTWPASTKLTLCNVPWDQNYRNVCTFNDAQSAQHKTGFDENGRDDYFSSISSSLKVVLTGATYCKVGEPVRVNVPYSKCYQYNYLIVENPQLPITGDVTPPKLFYFIVGASFVAPNTTHLDLQLDVWTTYAGQVSITSAFVERGHVAKHAYQRSIARLTGDVKDFYFKEARRYLVQPEGLDVGNAYVSVNEMERSFVGATSGTSWAIIVVSSVELEVASRSSAWGTVDNPKLPMYSSGSAIDGLPSGCGAWGLTYANYGVLLARLTDYPWIANNIQSITAVPRALVDNEGNCTIAGDVPAFKIASAFKYSGEGYYAGSESLTEAFTPYYVSDMLNDWSSANGATLAEWIDEPKSLVWPFSFLQYENFCGQPIIFKPERFAFNKVHDWIYFSVLPPFQRIVLFPSYYGADGAWNDVTSAQKTPADWTLYQQKHYGETFSNALLWNEFPQFSIVNDSYINYLAANAGTLSYARDNAGWQLDRSLAASQTSYDNAMRSVGAAAQNQQLAYSTQRDISRYSMGNLVGNQLRDTYNSLSSGARGAVNQAFGGADVSTIINTTVNASTGATANEVGNLQFQAAQQAQIGNIDANYQLQQWAARGDYQQAIAAIDASVQNAQVLPPTFSGTIGGGFMGSLASWGLVKYIISGHTLTLGYQARIASYWQKFGYAVCEYMAIATKFCVMEEFTYWKAQDVTLTGEIEEGVKEAIRGIFEKGVTVWRSADHIGDVAYFPASVNTPIAIDALY